MGEIQAQLLEMMDDLKVATLAGVRMIGDAEVVDAMVDAMWSMLNALMQRGFTREEAMQLLVKQSVATPKGN